MAWPSPLANFVAPKQFKHTEILVPGTLSHECLTTLAP